MQELQIVINNDKFYKFALEDYSNMAERPSVYSHFNRSNDQIAKATLITLETSFGNINWPIINAIVDLKEPITSVEIKFEESSIIKLTEDINVHISQFFSGTNIVTSLGILGN